MDRIQKVVCSDLTFENSTSDILYNVSMLCESLFPILSTPGHSNHNASANVTHIQST